MDMQGKTVVVTGASRGIGEAAARAFWDAGAHVVLLARSGDAIGAIARDLGERALAVSCDVASWSQVKAAIDQAVWRFGAVDVLVGNAGIVYRSLAAGAAGAILAVACLAPVPCVRLYRAVETGDHDRAPAMLERMRRALEPIRGGFYDPFLRVFETLVDLARGDPEARARLEALADEPSLIAAWQARRILGCWEFVS